MPSKEYINCPNCGERFDKSFKYCPHCGQENKKINLGFKLVLSEFLAAIFNVDSKLLLTLKLLLFKPGLLTREFLDGKRTKYISPIRLYLLISLIYFFVLSFSINSDTIKIDEDQETAVDTIAAETTQKTYEGLMGGGMKESETDSLSTFEKLFNEKFEYLKTKQGKEIFWNKFRGNISKGMFLLMPLTAFILMLLFFKNHYYYEHLILIVHLQSVWFIVFIFSNLLELIAGWSFLSIELLFLLFITVYWIKQFYRLSLKKAIWKTILFMLFFGFILSIFFVITIVVSIYLL